MSDQAIAIFWFRRDLRFEDNVGLYHALQGDLPVLPLFIFDRNILDDLEEKADARVMFLHDTISNMHERIQDKGSTMLVKYGKPEDMWREVIREYPVRAVYTNRDYEPYAKERD